MDTDENASAQLSMLEARLASAERDAKRASSAAQQLLRAKDRQIVEMSTRLAAGVVPAHAAAATASVGVDPITPDDEGDEHASGGMLTQVRLGAAAAALTAAASKAALLETQVLGGAARLRASEEHNAVVQAQVGEAQAEVQQLRDDLARAKSAAAGTAAPDSPGTSTKPEALLRAKERQVVAQSVELGRTANELRAVRLQLDASRAETKAALVRCAADADAVSAIQAVLGDASQELQRGTEREAELRHDNARLPGLVDEVQRLRQRATELANAADHAARFRAQHEHCGQELGDQRGRIVRLEHERQASAAQLAVLLGEKRDAAVAVAALEAQAAANEGKLAETVRRSEAAHTSLTQKADDRRTSQSVLEQRCNAAEAELKAAVARGAALQRRGDAMSQKADDVQRAANEAQEAHDAALLRAAAAHAAEVQSVVVAADAKAGDHAALLQATRGLEADRDAKLSDHDQRKGELRRLTLELAEAQQLCERERRNGRRANEELQRMYAHLNDLEGSHMDTATSSRRLTGLLESMTIDLSTRVAEHLRREFMSGGSNTAQLFQRTFNLDAETARDMVDVLAHLYLMIRAKLGVEHMCKMLGLQEITVRRIVTGFLVAYESGAPTERRQALTEGTAAAQRFTFHGCERMTLLCVALLPRARRSAGNAAGALGADMFVLAKICAFLPPVIVGHPSFAYHKFRLGDDAAADDEGQTVLAHMDMAAGTFRMLEAQVSRGEQSVVVMRGTVAVDRRSAKRARVALHYETQQRATFAEASGAAEDALRWSEWEPVSDATRSSSLQFNIRWDSRHDGLIAENVDGGGALPEVSVQEADGVWTLYRERVTLDALLSAAEWKNGLGGA
jgi:hypothetical protein